MGSATEERNKAFVLEAFDTLANRRDFAAGQRFWSPNRVTADIVRLEDGLIVEHWDVVQDEATAEESTSGLPMLGDTLPTSA
jgi:hypothetical protein